MKNFFFYISRFFYYSKPKKKARIRFSVKILWYHGVSFFFEVIVLPKKKWNPDEKSFFFGEKKNTPANPSTFDQKPLSALKIFNKWEKKHTCETINFWQKNNLRPEIFQQMRKKIHLRNHQLLTKTKVYALKFSTSSKNAHLRTHQLLTKTQFTPRKFPTNLKKTPPHPCT